MSCLLASHRYASLPHLPRQLHSRPLRPAPAPKGLSTVQRKTCVSLGRPAQSHASSAGHESSARRRGLSAPWSRRMRQSSPPRRPRLLPLAESSPLGARELRARHGQTRARRSLLVRARVCRHCSGTAVAKTARQSPADLHKRGRHRQRGASPPFPNVKSILVRRMPVRQPPLLRQQRPTALLPRRRPEGFRDQY